MNVSSVRRRLGIITAGILPIVLGAGVGLYLVQHPISDGSHPSARRLIPVSEKREHAAAAAHWINGVDIADYKDLAHFEKVTGEKPQMIGIYIRMTDPFPVPEVKVIEEQGAEPLIQLYPRGISMQKVADGVYDAQLRAWKVALLATRLPVILSFAHEMNGPWSSWGCEHTTAPVFIAAWRHVWTVLGTKNITWLWNVNEGWSDAPCSMLSRWPGASYVNWVGLDGYLRQDSAPFADGIGFSVRKLERATGKPVLLAEGGVSTGPGAPIRMHDLYQGAESMHCIGIVYFDSGTVKGDYRPQDDPAMLTAFKTAVGETTR